MNAANSAVVQASQVSTGLTAAHVLAVDDDPSVRQMIVDYLGDNDMRVTAVPSGRLIADVMARDTIDLVVLDLRLPGEDGMEIARRLRGESPGLPIIMLTGRKDEADRVMGLELGADDYLTKPFSPRELLARIRTVLRRTQLRGEPGTRVCRAYRIPGWELNLRTRRLTASNGTEIALSNGEFNLLAALLATGNRVVSRDQLIEMSRRYDNEVYDRAIDVQILRLRRKIEVNPAEPKIIVTERGAGYRLGVAVETVY
jgi:two-component system OmpR family response regulator